MRRKLFFTVLIVAVLLFFMKNMEYQSRVRGYRLAHISNEKQESDLITFIAEINEMQGGRLFVTVLDGVWRGRKIVLKLPKSMSLNNTQNLSSKPSKFYQFSNASRIWVVANQSDKQYRSPKNSAFDYDKYLYSLGYDGVYRVLDIGTERAGFSFKKWRRSIRGTIRETIQQYGFGNLMDALILGDKNAYDSYDAMKRLGISHLLVISGLHFAIMHRFIAKLLFAVDNKYWRAFFIMLAMTMMLFVVKTSYSAQRAYFTVMYSEVARLKDRKGDVLTSQSFSLLCILLMQPNAVLSVGLYLSFYLYLSIAFLYKKLSAPTNIPIWDMVRFSVFIQFVTLPISAFLFGRINLYSAMANVIVVPVFGLMVPLAFVSLGLAGVPLIGVPFVQLWNFLEWVIANLVMISPLHTLNINVRGFELFIFAGMLLLLTYIFTFSKKRWYYVLVALICFLPISTPMNQVVVFDVCHGDSHLLQFGGITCLVDTGDGRTDIAGELVRQGVTKLDVLIITHAHQDHHGGVEKLVERLPIDYVFITENTAKKHPELKNMTIVDENKAYRIKKGSEELSLNLYRFYSESDENDNGICVRLQHGDFITYSFGDAGKEIVNSFDLEEHVDFCAVPHHGSETSVSDNLYRENSPKLMTVSHSTKYGLPSDDFIQAVKNSPACVLSTYYSGFIIYDGKKYKTYLNP